MATYTWRSSSGAFDDANNWNPAVVPGTSDTAQLSSTGGTISGSGSVDTVAFSVAGWTIAGQLSANTATISSGALALGAGAQLLVSTSFSVSGGATVFINTNAALITAQTAAATIGAGTLNVNARGVGSFGGALRLGYFGVTNAAVTTGLLTVGGVLSLGASAGGSAVLAVTGGGEAVINALQDNTASYLQVGAVAGSAGVVRVDGANSLLLLSQDSAAIGYAGSAELDVTNGASARFNSGNNGLNPALVIAAQPNANGTVVVAGSGSTVAVAGSLLVGKGGSGVLRVNAGGSVTSTGLTAAQAALAVAASGTGAGTVTIDGAGSSLIAAGMAIVGGDNRGAGFVPGGVGTIAVTGGALLQSNGVLVQPGSRIAVDGASQEIVGGDFTLLGSAANFGTLSISGTLTGSGTLSIGGGFTGVGALSQATVNFTAPDATLRVSAVNGTSQVTGLQSGDVIDLVGNASAQLVGNAVATSTGSLALGGGGPYTLSSDGNGGTFVTLGVDTVGVFRFFDSNYGTHFFSASAAEKATIIATRPDLVYEGVGLESIDPAAADPNASPVYRFFDSTYGTHFFTASAAERDTVIASRPDLIYEGVGFLEHNVQQPGDVGVYRFFDTHYGTHFYTADPNERAMIEATRPDLIDEGIGFYAPSQAVG